MHDEQPATPPPPPPHSSSSTETPKTSQPSYSQSEREPRWVRMGEELKVEKWESNEVF